MTRSVNASILIPQEDAHISKTEKDKALFAVFDGHGGREVAVYCAEHYQDILEGTRDVINMESEKEWLRQSFMKFDELLLTDTVQKEIEEMRR